MPRQVPDREIRQRIFLRALERGSPVAEACRHSRLSRSTLYEWREQDATFRDAWDAAAETGAALRAVQRDDLLLRRALEGVPVPVVHRGEIIGERLRYSDRALMFGMRDVRLRQEIAREAEAAAPRVRVVIRRFGQND